MTRSLTCWGTTLGLLACAPYPASKPITGGREATLGCYRLSFGSWSKGSSVPDSILTLSTISLPQTIHLHATGEVTPRWRVFGQGSTEVSGRWTLFRNDSLIVIWDAETLTLHLRPYSDSLAGTAELGFSEAHGVTWPSAPLMAWHVRCP